MRTRFLRFLSVIDNNVMEIRIFGGLPEAVCVFSVDKDDDYPDFTYLETTPTDIAGYKNAGAVPVISKSCFTM